MEIFFFIMVSIQLTFFKDVTAIDITLFLVSNCFSKTFDRSMSKHSENMIHPNLFLSLFWKFFH